MTDDTNRCTAGGPRPRAPAADESVGRPALGVQVPTMKKLLFAMALGAFLAWALDPEQGSRRREDVRRRLADAGLIAAGPTVAPTTA